MPPIIESISSFSLAKLLPRTRKEHLVNSKLPPTIFRLFGEGKDLYQQLSTVPDQFKCNVVILTTADTPEAELSSVRPFFRVIQSDTVTTETAKNNSSLLLNEGLKFGRANRLKYLLYLSSGFQRHLEMFYSMTKSAMDRFPDSDVYYFILPETHDNVSIAVHKQAKGLLQSDPSQFLKTFFPYETALVMRTSLFDFETVLSEKGAMGNMSHSEIPLGGMEFMMTLLSKYAEHKQAGTKYSPKMVGITLPIPTRVESANQFYRAIDPFYETSPSSLAKQTSLEVTSSEDKQLRREATFQAAFNRLSLRDEDIKLLFKNTQFMSGVPEAFRFENEKSPNY